MTQDRLRMPWRPLLCTLVLVNVSLIVAFATRAVLMLISERVGTGTGYSDFVQHAVVSYRNAILPMLIGSWLVSYAHERWGNRLLPWGDYCTSIASLSIFFGLMYLSQFFVGPATSFPRQTWIPAWIIALLLFTTLTVVGQLDQVVRDRIIYNRAWHVVADSLVVVAASASTYTFRFDGIPPAEYQSQFWLHLPYVVVLYVGANGVWRVYSFVWRFTGLREAIVLALSTTTAGLAALLARVLVLAHFDLLLVPYGVLLAQPPLAFTLLLGVRMLRRVQYNYLLRGKTDPLSPAAEKRVLLVGAGNAGMILVRDLAIHRNFKVVGFLDDDRRKQGTIIGGVRVLGTTRDVKRLARERAVDEVVFCMPSAPRAVIRRVASDCSELGIPTSTVPGLSEILLGKVKVGQLRPVRMEDLLGRQSVELGSDDRELRETYSRRSVLVTGAAGSIGSELVRQLRELNPTRLILLDKDENGVFETALEMREDNPCEVVEIVADIRDRRRLERIILKWKPEVLFHAAAYKHVPMMEHHPSEAILNNIVGTQNLVDLADENHVRTFVLISTDKAVNPTSVMGASKRIAEMIVRDRAMHGRGTTRFCSVRFGNVLGSRASVVPLFQKRIAQGKSIEITHPDIKRYFMTIAEAVQLVIQAGSLGWQGETFVLDMGDPVRIADLAKELIEQSGLVPGKDIEIEFTGLRPGEKLFEELLLTEDSGARNTKYPKIFVDKPISFDWPLLKQAVTSLEEAAREDDAERIYELLRSLNIGYQRKVVSLVPASGA